MRIRRTVPVVLAVVVIAAAVTLAVQLRKHAPPEAARLLPGADAFFYLDLSKADEGIIKREARFGYIEMPNHLHLNQAVNLESGDGYMWLRIATEKNYDLATGKSGDEE